MAHGLYQSITGRTKPRIIEEGNRSPAEDALIKQQRLEWTQSQVTQNVMSTLANEVDELETDARQLAVSYHTHNNHQQIISKLIKADTLRKVIEKHASGK